jgi:hypothetical protein
LDKTQLLISIGVLADFWLDRETERTVLAATVAPLGDFAPYALY